MSNLTTTIYYKREDGRIIEWQNWKEKNIKRPIFGKYLSDNEVRVYKRMKGLDCNDKDIFIKLHPEILSRKPETKKVNEKVELPIEILNKVQLMWLIENKLNAKMPTLKKLSEEDLIKLFKKINY